MIDASFYQRKIQSAFQQSLLAVLYRRYGKLPLLQSVLESLRPAVVGLIASAAVGMLLQVAFAGRFPAIDPNWVGLGLFVGAFWLLRRHRWNPILVMVLCGGVNLLLERMAG